MCVFEFNKRNINKTFYLNNKKHNKQTNRYIITIIKIKIKKQRVTEFLE